MNNLVFGSWRSRIQTQDYIGNHTGFNKEGITGAKDTCKGSAGRDPVGWLTVLEGGNDLKIKT